jgi:alanine racemase
MVIGVRRRDVIEASGGPRRIEPRATTTKTRKVQREQQRIDAMGEQSAAEAFIDHRALAANARLAADCAQGREVIGVVKANAYGHGAVEVAKTLVAQGCRRLAVVSVGEAIALREAGIGSPQILLLAGLQREGDAAQAVAQNLTPVLHGREDFEFALAAGRRQGRPLPVHVEVDTAMTRMGVPREQAAAFLAQVAVAPELDLDGAFTHFSRADDEDLEPCLEQLSIFRGVLARASEQGAVPRSIHVANSAGLLVGKPLFDALPQATAVRPGLMLYGVRPGPHLGDGLKAVMRLETQVVRVETVEAGRPVGYGAQFCAKAQSRIATLPLGYADGIPCATAGRGQVWIAGQRYPIAGRVSMDYIGVDLGSGPAGQAVGVGHRAVIFGNAGVEANGISVEEAAAWAGTIPYEPLVRVGQRVVRRDIAPSSDG